MSALQRWAAVLVCALAAVVAAPASGESQRVPPGSGGVQGREELERRVQARFAEMMRQRLGLTAAEAQQLNQTVESFAGERRRLLVEEETVRRRAQAFLGERNATEADATALLSRMRELRHQEARLFQAEQEALLTVLTPIQVVQFLGMRAELGERIQQLRRGQGPPGGAGSLWRRPPGGVPPGQGPPDA